VPAWRSSRALSATKQHPPSTSSSQQVPGNCCVCSAASVSAPYETNSPAGIRITRVTENTSTSDSASSA
jgi:hypothetical protein